MRNLKRVLSLAMASVMLLGLMVVGVGAKAEGYPDVTSDHHTEAIEVLQAVGIMSGDDDGNFEPDRQLKRDEMAVVMCNLLDLNVKQYGGTHPFTDVPEWAAPYVEACYTNGIIAGYSSTYFGAEDVVTTAQASLMLMKALGYFQYQRDFGTDWLLATVTQGSRIEIYEDVDANVRGAMTRNDVAQLVLNALEAGTVEADVSNILDVHTGDLAITSGATKYNLITSNKSYASAISGITATSIGTAQSGPIVQLGEKLFNGDLKKTEGTDDAFGRPADQWMYKSNEIGTYPDKPILTSTKKVSKADMYSLIGKTNIDRLNVNGAQANGDALHAYFNGVDVSLACGLKGIFDANDTEAIGNKGAYQRSGLGVLTEIYQDSDNNVTVVLIPTYVAQASSDYNSSNETLKTVTLTGPAGFAVGTLNLEDWPEIKNIKNDDYILYTASMKGTNASLESLEVAEIVTGTVTAYSPRDGKPFGDAGGYVTLDETQHSYAMYAEVDGDNGCEVEYSVGDTASIVVDKDGNTLYVDDASLSVGNFLYVDGIVLATGFNNKYLARVYFADGTSKTITIDTMKDSKNNEVSIPNTDSGSTIKNTETGSRKDIATGAESHGLDGWYSYSESGGEYTLKMAKTSVYANTTAAANGQKIIDEDKVAFGSGITSGWVTDDPTFNANFKQKNNSSIALPDAGVAEEDFTKIRADEDTVFVVVEDDGGTDEVSIYQGLKNIPTVTAGTNANIAGGGSDGVTVAWVNKQDRAGKTAGLVFVYADGDSTVTGGTTDTLLYAINKDHDYYDKKNGETIERWNVVLNGELTTADCKSGNFTANTAYDRYRLDSDGYYKVTSNDQITNLITTANDTFRMYLNGADDTNLTTGSDYVVYSANTLKLGSGGSVGVGGDTEITLIMNNRVTAAANNVLNVMKDAYTAQTGYICWTNVDRNHEVWEGWGARAIDSFLEGRYVSGAAYGIKESTNSDYVTHLYIVITGVGSLPTD